MKKLLLFLLFFLWLLPGWATHIVGGEFQLRHIAGADYQITLNMYFDKINGNPGAIDPVITVSIFEKVTNRRMVNINMSSPKITPVKYTSIVCTSGSLSTDKIVYVEDITLSPSVFNNPNGYYLVWERCCRNGVINNIINPGAAGQTFYLEFPAVTRNNQAFVNSSAELFQPVSDYACINELFYYEFGGQDPDGDSLVYEVVTPLNGYSNQLDPAPMALPGPYVPVQWTAGLSTSNQIPGSPTLTINQHTGQIQVQPTQLGLFVFGIRCSEYRNKVKIGEVRRDYQLLVLNCPRNEKPGIKMKAGGATTYYQEGDVITIRPNDNRCFDFFMTDPDANENLTVEAKGVNFKLTEKILSVSSGIVNRNGLLDTLTSSACFKTCLDSQGKPFIVDFIVSDDGCSLPKKDTVRVSFVFVPEPDTPPLIATTAPASQLTPKVGDLIAFDVTGTDAENDEIKLNLKGRNFDLATLPITFAPKTGNGNVTSPFSWRIDCAALSQPTYILDFTATTIKCGVPVTSTTTIEINIGYEVPVAFIPANIFTPNNDGLNDYFQMPTLPPDFCESIFSDIKIYNRWGSLVYKSTDRTFKWDGNSVSEGVYYYVITYTDKEFKGTVTKVK
ncbi:gliding motility-associated C-terminal domain-containing protein [Adhaeribacter rhizoryzae]|uniref:Gliding motility-associated C-terminal domain-containing protein n=1 Tax=Adhaeribacter rhizoryzae TaxID=2607907 RepID=A0A5M6DL50_9BACT|nr:gliding motility-associated C-terminal domain-containing protein [Adhaeribacter rhizoryzae]KAA5548277.1 gliding motility-associated C-terminal domain-containing protein [Adhaeribacter rhizoryzae]